ncbi:MAG: WecB/TagA/CpsF family glycosyltransferase [Bacilli bacterium]|nr:WecB/TagA/CpsF family glycosyltransferase [Bacilli bacterium]MDD4406975.1 WecB/TagA/CpsF family glycosyltransferase [Bacilli bacterium]
MNKILDKSNLIKAVLVLYTLSIILDLHIFYNSISTLIRLGIISIIFLIIFIKYSNKKERNLFLIYFFFLFVYSIAHFINASNFTNKIPTIYSNLDEVLYIYKMIMNIFIIYIVYKLNINLKQFMKYMKISLWFICGSIVLCNLFKLGYSTYSFKPIEANIFSWFTSKDNSFTGISGKGYFHLGNQIIAIILLYYPLLLNEIKDYFKKTDIILSIVVLLSMLILGNRLSTVGPLIIILLSLLIHLFLVFIKREKLNTKFFTLVLISIIIYNIFLFYSPLIERTNYRDNKITNSINNLENNSKDNLTEKKNEVLTDQFNSKLINLNFPLKYYKYENDPEFWENMLTKSPIELSNTRYIEISVIKRVKTLNNSSSDNWLGIGYDRVINIFNIERDYVMQYYSIGLIGTILLLSIYFIVYIFSFFKVLVNLEIKLTFKNLMLLLSIGIFLLAAYFSGNLLNAISTILPLSFVLGILYNELRVKKNHNNKILGFKIPLLSEDNLINNLTKEVNNNKQVIIYNINPIIMMNFYNNINIKKEFNLSNYNIPDGIGVIYASKMKDINLTTRIAGIDFFGNICKLSRDKKLKIYLYGGKKGIAEKVKKVLEDKYPRILIKGTLNGYVNNEEAIKKIKAAKPDVLFVALGTPLQEEFIINNKKQFSKIKIIMPVGGTFDVVSGKVNRAPSRIIKLNLEWIYRMVMEPTRIKINLNIIKYVFLVIFKNDCYNEETKFDINDSKNNR